MLQEKYKGNMIIKNNDLFGKRLIILKNGDLILQKVSNLDDYLLITPTLDQNFFRKILLIKFITTVKPFRFPPMIVKNINIIENDLLFNSNNSHDLEILNNILIKKPESIKISDIPGKIDELFFKDTKTFFKEINKLVPSTSLETLLLELKYYNGVGITEEELLKEISFSFDNYNMIIEKLKRNVVFYSDIEIKLYNGILLLISIKNNKPEVFITYFSKEKKDAIYNNALDYYKSMNKKGIQVILDDNFK